MLNFACMKKIKKITFKKIVFTSVLLFSFISFSQQNEINSIKNEIKNAKNQESKIDNINKLGIYWYETNYDSASYYFEKARLISKKNNYKKGLFDYASNMGNVYMYQGKFDKMKLLMQSSMQLAKSLKDKHYIAIFTINLGCAYMYDAQYEKAIEKFQEGIVLFQKNNETKYFKKINNYISICFLTSGNFSKSIEYANRALSIANKEKDSSTIADVNSILGKNYIEKKEFKLAKPFIEKALLLSVKLNKGDVIADSQFDKSRILFSEKKYNEAIDWCNKSLSYYNQTGNVISKVNSLCYISDYYLKYGDNANALKSITEAEDLATKNNLKSHLLLVYTTFSLVNKKINDFKGAFKYLEKWQVLNDSLISNDLKNKLQVLDTKFQSAQKDKNILVLEKNQIKQRTFIYSLAGISLGLLIFSFLLYKNYRARKKIKDQEIIQLHQEKKIDATQNMIQGEEQERTRLARDLHDGLGGMLTGVKFQLNSMKGNVILSEENAGTFTKSISQIDNAIAEMRRVAHNMMPEALLKFGLDETLKSYCDSVSENSKLTISYQSFGMENRLEQTTEIVLYRIVQELLNNTIKHAKATKSNIQLTKNGTLITLTVEDNGKGFDINVIKNGIGLSNINHRVEYLNGKMDVQSDNKGTSTHIEFEIA